MLKRFVVVAAFLLAAVAASGNGFLDDRAREWVDRAYEYRGDARALAYLVSLYDLWGNAEYGSIQPGLEKIAAAPDAHPMVAAKARNILRFCLMNRDRWEEARLMADGEGFLTDWMLIAPFGNTDRTGFGEVYGPELELDLSKPCKGMDRDVFWRRLPGYNYNGTVPLGDYIDPSENAAAYLATFIRSAGEADAVLRCSFSGAHKVWLNGEEIATNSKCSWSAFDQFSYPCRLSPGLNVLLVKTCHSGGPWALRARLTGASGAPLVGFASTNDPSRISSGIAAALKRSGLARKGFAFYDPLTELENAAAKGGWKDKFLLGLYLYGIKCFDVNEHRDADTFREALAAGGAPDWINYFVGVAETDGNKSRESYEKAVNGDYAVESLINLHYYYNRRGMRIPAVRHLEKALLLRPEDPYLRCQRYAMLSGSLSEGHAEREMEKLRAAHPENLAVLQTLLWMKESGKDVLTREKLYRELLGKDFSEETALGLFIYYAAQGRTGEAAGVLGDHLSKVPGDRSLTYRLSSYLLDSGMPAEAEKTIAPFLEYAPDWAGGRELLGEIYIAEGDSVKALAQFEKALLLNPQNDNLKRRLAYIKPGEELFYEPFRIPRAEIPSAGSGLEDEPVVVLLDNTFVSVEPSGLSSRYVQLAVKVQNPAGAKAMSAFPITFDPDWQDVRVLDSIVERPDGTKMRAESYVTSALSDPEYQLYYRTRQLVLSFPSLREGDVVAIEYLITDTGEANTFGRYFGDLVPFENSSPVMIKKYTLRVPDSLPVTYVGNNLGVEPSVIRAMGKTTYQWTKKDIAKTRTEPYSPGFGERSSYVHVSTFEKWEDLGKWYAYFIKDQWDPGENAADTARRLTADSRSVADKVRAVHAWVVGQTRYVGLEFGVHGYKPYRASQIFQRRFGDCKDKAILLCSMLSEAGVEARMVLVRTRNLGAVGKTPASLATFNHAICYVPALDLFLDGTAEYSGLEEVPYLDRECDVLVIARDGASEVKRVPPCAPGDNIYSASYGFELKKDEKSSGVDGRFLVKGQEASDIRSGFKNPDKRKEILEKQLSANYPGSRIADASFSDMSDINLPIDIRFSGSVREISRPAGEDSATLPLWIGGPGILSRFCALKERTNDLVLAYPWVQDYTITYKLPPGTKAVVPAEENVESRFGAFTRAASVENGTVTVRTTLTLTASRVPASDYGEFRDFAINVDKFVSERMKVQW